MRPTCPDRRPFGSVRPVGSRLLARSYQSPDRSADPGVPGDGSPALGPVDATSRCGPGSSVDDGPEGADDEDRLAGVQPHASQGETAEIDTIKGRPTKIGSVQLGVVEPGTA